MTKYLIFLVTVLLSLPVRAQDSVVTASVQGYVFKPAHVEPTDERVQQLSVPSGFTVQIIKNLPDGGQHPNRTIKFGPDGKLYPDGSVLFSDDTGGVIYRLSYEE